MENHLREDVHISLKTIFYIFDEYCKIHGYFYDIVNDEPNCQGFLVKADRQPLYDYMKSHADRLHVIIDTSERKDGVLFKFALEAINDGHWEVKTDDISMSPFANREDAEKVRKNETMYQKKGFKKLSSRVDETVAVQREPDTNFGVPGTGSERTNICSDEPRKRTQPKIGRQDLTDVAKKTPSEIIKKSQEVKPLAYNPREDFDRVLDTLLERTQPRISQGHVDDPKNLVGSSTRNPESVVPNPAHLPEEPLTVPEEPIDPFRGKVGMTGVRQEAGASATPPIKNAVGQLPSGGEGAFQPTQIQKIPPIGMPPTPRNIPRKTIPINLPPPKNTPAFRKLSSR
jgi:hypothetical protein